MTAGRVPAGHGDDGGTGMSTLLLDVRYGIRQLLRTPVVTLIATVSVALGIVLLLAGQAMRGLALPGGGSFSVGDFALFASYLGYIIDQDGSVLLTSTAPGATSTLDVASLSDAIRSVRFGVVQRGDGEMIEFNRLRSVDWTYLVRVRER